MKKYVGIDIGGTSVKGILTDENGTILKRSSISTRATRPFEEVATDIAAQIKALADGEKIEGVGVGCPGAVDSGSGVIYYSNNLYWKDAPLGERLHSLTGATVKVSNDANVAALGEFKFGAGKAYSDAVLITLGTGVGGGIVANGKLFEGCYGLGAEIGHMVIHTDGVQCTCGRRGCFEAYASATALIRQTTFAMQTDRRSAMWDFVGGDLNKVDGRTSFECAKKGDATAQRVVDAYISYLAEGALNIVNIFRSQAIMLGGGVCAQGKVLTEPLKERINKGMFGGVHKTGTDVVIASLGNDAGSLGAAGLLMD